MADKFEREIDEIIRNSGADLPPPPRSTPRAVQKPKATARRWRLAVNAGQVMFASVALLLAGGLLWSTSNGLGGLIMLSAVTLFLFSYLLFFGKRATGIGEYEKRWRGHPIIDTPPVPLSDHFKGWWRRVRHRN